MVTFALMHEGGVAGEARQLAGLLRAGSEDAREIAAQRVARLVAEACTDAEPGGIARTCAALRDSVLALCEEDALSLADARMLCAEIDTAEGAALDAFDGARRAVDALQRALSATSARDIPRLAVEGAPAADFAALLVEENGALVIRTTSGEDGRGDIAAQGSVAARAARGRAPVEGSDTEGARAVIAIPLRSGSDLLAVLRVSSRASIRFSADEKKFLRAIATRGATLLAGMEVETRLRQTLRTFELLIEASPLPILSIDRRGRVQAWNHAAEEMFGWTHDEVIGHPSPLIPPEKDPEARAIFDEVNAGGVIRNREVRRLRKDGRPVDLALSMAPLRDTAGNVTGSIAILADVTDRTRREQELERTARFREHFVGIVTHDLRNPLTAIVTSAQLLMRYGELPERQARVVGRIASSADRMARMIDDLLDFARSRLGGGFPIERKRVDLRQLCEQTVEELEFAWTRSIPVKAEGELWGNWDPDRIAQVISNLVGNALQHSQGEVRVTLRAAADTVVLETWNGGPPIPAEVIPHLFEPGRRAATSSGLGLGLYIVQQIVLAHGGRIEVRSAEHEGTTFAVTLPRKARQQA